MSIKKIAVAAITLTLALAAPALAQTVDPTGTWALSFNSAQGPIEAQMVVKKDGDKFVGTISSEIGEAPIEAAVKDKAVTVGFSMNAGGGQLNVTLNGTIDGDSIRGTYDAGGSGGGDFSGTRTPKTGDAATTAPGTTTAPAEKVDVSGAWTVQVTTSTISASPTVTLKQDGDKLTGEYESSQYGKFPLTGTVTGNKVEFTVAMSIEGNALSAAFSGTADKDGLKGNVSYGDFAEGTFTATKKK